MDKSRAVSEAVLAASDAARWVALLDAEDAELVAEVAALEAELAEFTADA